MFLAGDGAFTTVVAILLSPPPLSDRDRFPDMIAARTQLECCRLYRDYLYYRRLGSPLWQECHWRAQAQRANYIYQCWDWLHAAQGGEGQGEAYWRKSLGRLRELLGEEDYYAGRMPTIP